jgi:hypothetical protein
LTWKDTNIRAEELGTSRPCIIAQKFSLQTTAHNHADNHNLTTSLAGAEARRGTPKIARMAAAGSMSDYKKKKAEDEVCARFIFSSED